MSKNKLEHILHCHPMMETDITRAEDTCLYDAAGKKYIDFEAGIWCMALGHSNPRINRVMTEQINKAVHLHHKLTSGIAEVLAVNLLELFHFEDGRAVFLSSGSEAVELSIRIARLISPKRKVLTFSNSYLSALSSNAAPRDKDRWHEVDFMKCSSCPFTECTIECPNLNHVDFNDISAFIFEPAICGRVIFPPYKLVKFLETEVRKHGGIIAANEVTTGFGRTGKWFGHNHYDYEPDIVALGKSLGNGYPISAVAMSNAVAKQLEARNFVYVQSHQNDPLGCAAANEVLNIFKENDMVSRAKHVGEYFLAQLLDVRHNCSCVKEVRGIGLMLALELNIENRTELISERMLERGYFLGTVPSFNVLRFSPALTISEHDIEGMCTELKALLRKLEE